MTCREALYLPFTLATRSVMAIHTTSLSLALQVYSTGKCHQCKIGMIATLIHCNTLLSSAMEAAQTAVMSSFDVVWPTLLSLEVKRVCTRNDTLSLKMARIFSCLKIYLNQVPLMQKLAP